MAAEDLAKYAIKNIPTTKISDDYISNKKFFSEIKKEARSRAKRETCFLCGKPCTSFCNSHTVPRAVLEKISRNGKVFSSNAFGENTLPEYGRGVKNSGIFLLICKDCDSKLFQGYEGKPILNNLDEKNSEAYGEMATKNCLKEIYDQRLYSELAKIISEKPHTLKVQNFLAYKIPDDLEIKLEECESEIYKFTKERGGVKEISAPSINVIENIFLPYTVPVAFQGMLALATDLNDNVVNDLHSDNPEYKRELLHLCIFPLENSSRITLFTHNDNKRYDKFKSQLKNCNLDDKLSVINSLIFLYKVEAFFSGYLDIELIQTPNLAENFSLKNHREITNLLDKNFSIENLK